MPTELRVFISSTFQDMQEERGYLMKHVFPEIRQRCRERGIEFTEIDLRWGLTHEEGTLGRIIRTCFEEIDKCRPFFIGMVGSRYGWTPKYLDIQKDPDLLRKYPWIEQEVLDGASLLDLEFMHGVLRNGNEMSGAFFYARELAAAAELHEGEADHLALLTQRMIESSRPVRSFTDLQSLGDHVRADMLAAIDVHWPPDERNTRVATERGGHEAFSAARRHAYIANPGNLKSLNAHATGKAQPLMVVSQSGMGKSALLAYWSNAYKTKHPNAFVITHFIGTTPAGGSHGEVVRRILMEIKEHAGWEDDIPSAHLELEEALPLWLARLQEPLVLVIDALNQLDDRARDLRWLPAFFPAHVRVILSATPGAERDAARARGWQELELRALTYDEREALTVRFLGEYHKGLSESQTKRIASDPHSESPLFLRTVLEELRLFGYFQELDAHIDHYLSSKDLPDLFQRVLKRMEDDFGAPIMRDMMTLIWSSRNGLAENELMEMTGLNRAECSRLLLSLDYHVMQRDGRRTFFHDFLRKAVESRYVFTDTAKKSAHFFLGSYFATRAVSERRAEEEPWQWEHAGEWGHLHGCLIEPSLFLMLMNTDRQYSLLHYCNVLGEQFDPAIEYERLAGKLEGGTLDVGEASSFPRQAGRFLLMLGKYAAADNILMRAMKHSEDSGESVAVRWRIVDDLFTALFHLGELPRAEILVREMLEQCRETLGERDIITLTNLSNWGTVLSAQGKWDESSARITECLAKNTSDEEKFTTLRMIDLNNLATVEFHRGDMLHAADLLSQALLVNAQSGARDPIENIKFQINLGVVMKSVGEYAQAESLYHSALTSATELLGTGHPTVGDIMKGFGGLELARGNKEEALAWYERTYLLLQSVFGEKSIDCCWVAVTRGGILVNLGRVAEAATLYEDAIPILEEKLGIEHPQVKQARSRYAALNATSEE